MPRYWYRTDTGHLQDEVQEPPRPVGHSRYGITPNVTLPGPIAACVWDGAAVVVDPARLAKVKERLRSLIEEKALASVQEGVLSTPWGDFRVRRDDIDAYQMIGFAAIYAIQTSGPFSMNLRRSDDTTVTVTAAQFVRFLALIGDRMAAKITLRDARLDQLAAATAEDLKGFAP